MIRQAIVQSYLIKNLFLCLGVLVFAGTVSAEHPVSVVDADVYVNRGKTTMRLKCFAEDLELLQGVEAWEDGFYDSQELKEATQDHAKYLAEKIQLIGADGIPLKAKVVEIVDIEIPEEGIEAGKLMSYTMGFTLEFDYKEPPEFLTINQKMVAEGALLPTELKILLKQAGSDAPFTKVMKPDQPETFRFDWTKPALTSEASEKEWDEWFDDQREKTLGIESYSSIYSFIYITHTEIRHEILVPVATLTTFMEVEREDEYLLTVAEQDAIKPKLEALFSVGNEVTIDSVPVKPVFDRIDFYGLDLKDFAMQAERRDVSIANGRVGLILSYSTKGTPREVTVAWDKFNEVVKSVDSVVIAFDEVKKTSFSKFLEDNVYEWSEPERPALPPITNIAGGSLEERFVRPTMKLPVVSLALGFLAALALLGKVVFGTRWTTALIIAGVCVVGALGSLPLMLTEIPSPLAKPEFKLPDEEADEIFNQLHKNMFRAFDYTQDEDIYDALANSVDGEFLRELYLQINQSLKVKEQGGAVSRVDEVNVVEGRQVIDEEGVGARKERFNYQCKWNLIGTIEHWGHIHERTNQYDARFDIQLIDDAWKIVAMDFNGDPVAGTVKTSLRKF